MSSTPEHRSRERSGGADFREKKEKKKKRKKREKRKKKKKVDFPS